MDSRDITYGDIENWLQEHGWLVVCTVVRTQGSVPRRVGARMVVLPDGTAYGTVGGGLFESLAMQEARAALEAGKSYVKTYDFREVGSSPQAFGAICGGTADVFYEVASLPEHLLIVGGGHCGRALAQAATLLGRFRVTLADERLPGEALSELPPLPDNVTTVSLTGAYAELSALIDPATYVVLVSQGATTDEKALRQVINTPARYLGMMGSRKKVRTVLDHLREDGFDAALLEKVHAPVGLEIGAETPEEIAIAILAQIIQISRGAAAKQTA